MASESYLPNQHNNKIDTMFTKIVRQTGIKRMRLIVRYLKTQGGNRSLKQTSSLGKYLDIFRSSSFYKDLTEETIKDQFNIALKRGGTMTVGQKTFIVEEDKEIEKEIVFKEDVKEEDIEGEPDLIVFDQDGGAEDSDTEGEDGEEGEVDGLMVRQIELLKSMNKRYKAHIYMLEDTLQQLIDRTS